MSIVMRNDQLITQYKYFNQSKGAATFIQNIFFNGDQISDKNKE